MTTAQTLDQFIDQHQLRMTYRETNRPRDGWSEGSHHYAVTIYLGRVHPDAQKMHLTYSMGSGLTHPPVLADVLDCIASDCQGLDNTRGFEDWCADYSYDTDSRKAYATWSACMDQRDKVKDLLGTAGYRALLETERL